MGSRFHRTLVEESSDTVSVVDEDGVIRYVSPSVEDLLGFEPDELVGEGVYDYQHPQDRATIASAIKRPGTATRRQSKRGRAGQTGRGVGSRRGCRIGWTTRTSTGFW